MGISITLFDNMVRTDQRPARQNETLFDYLTASGRRPAACIRELLEVWFRRFSELAKQDLRNRFRSSINAQHLGAVFELYLHELLCSTGFTVRVHPDLLGDRKTRLDFLVLKGSQPCFYLEATLAGPSRDKVAENARIDQVYKTLNHMQSPNFFLAIRLRGAPATAPSGKRLSRELEQWLSGLDPDELEHRLTSQGIGSLPSFLWSHDGWDLHFIPIPKPAAVRGSPGVRPIGVTMPEMQRICHPSIRKAVAAKATKYGGLDLPFVVSVNVIDIFMQNTDILRYQARNELRGAWFGPTGPQNKGMSAALIAVGLDPWTIGNRTPIMIHHPWATHPFPPDQWPLPQWIPDLHEGSIVERPGKSVAEVLSLPNSWPPPDAL